MIVSNVREIRPFRPVNVRHSIYNSNFDVLFTYKTDLIIVHIILAIIPVER